MTPGEDNTRVEQGKPFLLRILTFNLLRGYFVENPIQTFILQCHIVVLLWFIERVWATCGCNLIRRNSDSV